MVTTIATVTTPSLSTKPDSLSTQPDPLVALVDESTKDQKQPSTGRLKTQYSMEGIGTMAAIEEEEVDKDYQ